jgi:hypothetical protein
VLIVEHTAALELPRGGRAHRFEQTTLTVFHDRGA